MTENSDDFKSAAPKLVAALDDEPDILELLEINFLKAGFKIKTFSDSDSLFDFLKKTLPDLILLDLMLPDTDGIDICKYLKRTPRYADIPVIMLTAKGEEMDKVLGLEIGADDYVTKPFSLRELIARARVATRKSYSRDEIATLKIAENFEIDINKYEVYVNDKKIELTTTEFKILKLLASRKGRVYSREEILESIGMADKGVLDRTVDVHIKNLREKLGTETAKFIKNVRGIGYKIEEY